MRPPSRMGPHAHSHTHLSGMVAYASPSIPNMSLHAALAAAKEKNYNIGAQFTVTVTACDKSVCDVPFGSRGAQPGTEMKKSFWKVRPPLADRRTVPCGCACSETGSTQSYFVCGFAELHETCSHPPDHLAGRESAAREGQLRDKVLRRGQGQVCDVRV